MRRREFLKLLAGATLGTLGTPVFAVQQVFGEEATTKKKLKHAVEELVDDPRRLVYLLGATYAQTSPDLRLVGAALHYWIHLGGHLTSVVRESRALREEPGVREFLCALRETLLGPDANRQDIKVGTVHQPLLAIEADIICSVWTGRTVVEQLDHSHGKGMGQRVLDAYMEQYGNTDHLLKLADAEIEVPDRVPDLTA